MSLTFDSKLKIKNSNLRVLIGTPVNEVKDYSMERWLTCVSRLTHPADLLIVDNSADVSYMEKIRKYCKKYGLNPVRGKTSKMSVEGQTLRTSNGTTIVHVDVPPDANLDEKLSVTREIIRKAVLDGGYDIWFSWESDVIAPPDTLDKLLGLLEDNWMVSHGYPARDNPDGFNQELGLTLITRGVLEKFGFIKEFGFVNPAMPQSYFSSDCWFIRKIDLAGKRTIVNGIIKPIYHLFR